MIKSLDFIATPERSRRTRFSFEEAPLAGMSMLSQREARMEAGRPCKAPEWNEQAQCGGQAQTGSAFATTCVQGRGEEESRQTPGLVV